MNIGKAIYGILSGTTAVTDIVGTKIFPEIAEQETAVPFVIYQVQSVQPEDTHDGPSKLDEVRVEVLCYDDAYNGAADLASAVRAALDRVSGTYNSVNVESVQFNDVDFEIEYDPRRYSQVLTFTFRIKRDDIEIALGTPITGAQLGDLSDVDVTGVTDNQILSYDAATGNWIPAADAGGPDVLDDLSDVDTGEPEDNQMLAYQQGTWSAIYQDEITLPIASVTGLQAALDDAPDNLRELTDVTISTPADGDYLQYDSAAGEWQNSSLIIGRNGEQYTGNYDSEAETLLDGATDTVELYYTAQADGDGLHEDAQTDTAQSGYDIQRKLYYAEKAQADPDTSGDWTQFTAIADNTTFANAKAALLAYLKERTGGTVPISLKMTWEEVAQAPAFTGLLNESYGSGAEAAYSTRRLNGNVTDCMVIRRASDSTTTTIGFDGSGNIDESAIETFCTGTTCTVVTWKDQSGNGNDATQSDPTKQPTIYTGGALVKENGTLAVEFSSDTLTLDSSITTNALCVFSMHVDSSNQYFPLRQGTTNYVWFHTSYGQLRALMGGAFAIDNYSSKGTMGLRTFIKKGTSGNEALSYVDGFNITTAGYETLDTETGTFTQLGAYTGKSQEVIVYTSDKSSVRTSIEENIGDYFTQNTPLLDTYSGAAAAYSLRLLDSTYTGALVEVYNGSSYADINANVFGELDTVALAAHCGSNDGFVSTWYDQSGGTLGDLEQTSTSQMRKIYDGATGYLGSLEKAGSGGYYRPSASSTISQPFSIFGVYDFGGLPDDYFFDGYGSSNRVGILDNSPQNGTQIFGGGSIYGARNITGKTITSAIFNGANSAVSVNGETAVTGTLTGDFDFITLGARYTTTATSTLDKVYEFVLYEDAKNDTDRVGIQNNLNGYYSAY